jgi:adenylylsulfate kinase-like enzyme
MEPPPPTHWSTGFAVWLTGLSGSGKSAIADILERELRARRVIETLVGLGYPPA